MSKWTTICSRALLGGVLAATLLASEHQQEPTSNVDFGDRYGIGVFFVETDSGTVVARCIDGGPGTEAGLREGDLLLSVDGETVVDWPLSDVLAAVGSDAPGTVTLEVAQAGERITVEASRRRIKDILAGIDRRLNEQGAIVPRIELPELCVGQLMPEVSLQDEDCNDVVVVSEARSTFIYFWASWCGPCKVLMHQIADSSYDNSKARLVAVNVDRDCDIARVLADSLHPPGDRYWTRYDGELAQRFRLYSRGLPTAVALDKSGRILGFGVGSAKGLQLYESLH